MGTMREVLRFWFGSIDGAPPTAEVRKRWFAKSEAFDAEIRERFCGLHASLMNGGHGDWLSTPRGGLARILVLDQFSRNLFRDDPGAFASDRTALETTDSMLEDGSLTELAAHEQVFVLMPLMHAEDRQRQEQSVREFEALAARAPDAPGLSNNVDYAHRHKAIIDRFGRYPHRNAILGRSSTAEEVAFLREPGSGF